MDTVSHPSWMIHPLYGLDKNCHHLWMIRPLLWALVYTRPLFGLGIFILFEMIRPVCGL